jgi:hypothetical protein
MARSGSTLLAAMRLALVVVACGTFSLVAACGGADEEPVGERVRSIATAPAPAPADATIAARAQLRLDDLPAGWQRSGKADESTADCAGVRGPRAAASGRANSPTFTEANERQADSGVYVFADAARARAAFRKLTSPATRACLGDWLAEKIRESAGPKDELDVGEPSSARLAVEPLGDRAQAGRVTLPLSAKGADVELTADFVFVRVGRGIALFAFVDVLTPFEPGLRDELTGKVVARLAAGLA